MLSTPPKQEVRFLAEPTGPDTLLLLLEGVPSTGAVSSFSVNDMDMGSAGFAGSSGFSSAFSSGFSSGSTSSSKARLGGGVAAVALAMKLVLSMVVS